MKRPLVLGRALVSSQCVLQPRCSCRCALAYSAGTMRPEKCNLKLNINHKSQIEEVVQCTTSAIGFFCTMYTQVPSHFWEPRTEVAGVLLMACFHILAEGGKVGITT